MSLQFGAEDVDTFGFGKNRKIEDTRKGLFAKGARRNVVLVARDGTGDFESIQEAVDKATTARKDQTIYLKEDTYTLTTTITLKSNLVLTGSPNAKITTTLNIPLITINGKNNIFVQDILLEGSIAAGTSNHGVYICGTCKDIFIKNCRIKNTGGSGIYVYHAAAGDTERVIIQNNWIYYPKKHGIYLYATQQDIYFCLIQNNNIKLPDDEGIRLEGHVANDTYVNQCIISGNIIDEATNAGIHIVNAKAIQNIVLGNNAVNTTGITDAGTNTEIAHNIV